MKTLKEKIEVMQAALDGKDIEWTSLASVDLWEDDPNPHFNWGKFDYRIKPEPRVIYIWQTDGGDLEGEHYFEYKPDCIVSGKYIKFIEVID